MFGIGFRVRPRRGWRMLAAGFALLALLALGFVPVAQALPRCELTVHPDMDFGVVNEPIGTKPLETSSTLQYYCDRPAGETWYVRLCINIYAGEHGATTTDVSPRKLANGEHVVNFQIYKDPSHSQPWGSIYDNAPYDPVEVTFQLSNGNPVATAPVGVWASIPAGQYQAVPGVYTNHFLDTAAGSLIIAYNAFSTPAAGCGGPTRHGERPNFTVRVKLEPACTVEASATPISVGNPNGVVHTETNLSGVGSISVQCSLTTAYNIGLRPSNGDDQGAGMMTHDDRSTDKIPYQLRSEIGVAGAIWGNTATAVDVGNGVHGVGTGMVQEIPVYVTVPGVSAARPGRYSDTVTVTVHY